MTNHFKIALSSQDIGKPEQKRYIEAFKNGFDMPLTDPLSGVIANCCKHALTEEIIDDLEYNIFMLKRAKQSLINIK